MIENIKSHLVASGLFKVVQLAQDMDPLSDFQNETPAAIVYQDKTRFSASSYDNYVKQAADKTFVVIIVCEATTVEALENSTISTLLGYTHASDYEPLEAVEADNHKITGFYYARRLIFTTRTYLQQGL